MLEPDPPAPFRKWSREWVGSGNETIYTTCLAWRARRAGRHVFTHVRARAHERACICTYVWSTGYGCGAEYLCVYSLIMAAVVTVAM